MTHLPSWVRVGAVAALVLADAALVWLAVRHVGEPTTTPPAGSVAEPTRPQPAPLTSGRVLLDATADGTVVRAARGRCAAAEGAARLASVVVEVSTDGGRSFAPVDVGERLGDVLRVSATSAGEIALVGVRPSCATSVYRSDDGGASWTTVLSTAGLWHLSRSDVRTVHSPTGSVRTGCEVRAVSSVGAAVARVLCSDGRLRGTDDGGARWVDLGSLSGAVDVEYATIAEAWAVAPTGGCAAAMLRTTNGGLDWERLGCLPVSGNPQGLAVAGDLLVAQAGGQVLVSSDGGRTFALP